MYGLICILHILCQNDCYKYIHGILLVTSFWPKLLLCIFNKYICKLKRSIFPWLFNNTVWFYIENPISYSMTRCMCKTGCLLIFFCMYCMAVGARVESGPFCCIAHKTNVKNIRIIALLLSLLKCLFLLNKFSDVYCNNLNES